MTLRLIFVISNQKHADISKRAQEILHLSFCPRAVVGREDSKSQIIDFCRNRIKTKTSGLFLNRACLQRCLIVFAGSMYISGNPGCGKTATIVQALGEFKLHKEVLLSLMLERQYCEHHFSAVEGNARG